jgi:hypothetical protein
MTSVADADLLGTELLAGVGATATRTSAVSKNVFKRIGYSRREALRVVPGQVDRDGDHADQRRGASGQAVARCDPRHGGL